jgi:hypothetical protein
MGGENRNKMLWAAGLGGVAVLALAYELIPMWSGSASTPVAASQPVVQSSSRPTVARGGPAAAKRVRAENLDPTLRLDLLAASEQTKYAGSGRNIFVSQADPVIPKVNSSPVTDETPGWKLPQQQPAPPIPLKFFGFASKPGEPKRIFLSQGEDVFIAGEGEIVNRRYKVVRISPASVEIQDVVGSGPPQSIPLTQG